MDLHINSWLTIPAKELKWRFTKSSGPGGQGVNTTDSQVELIFNLKNSSVLNSYKKQRLFSQLESRLIKGCLIINVNKERSQLQNRRIALERMKTLIQDGLLTKQKLRIPSTPSKSSKRTRLKDKRIRGAIKKNRQGNISQDD